MPIAASRQISEFALGATPADGALQCPELDQDNPLLSERTGVQQNASARRGYR